MNAKDYIIDFLNYVVLLFLFFFLFVYFFIGDRLGSITKIMQSLVPLSYFFIFFLLRFRHSRRTLKKRKEEIGGTDLVLHLTYRDKIIDEVLIFSLPVIIIWIAHLKGVVDIYTIFQAGIVFIIMFIWHNVLFIFF